LENKYFIIELIKNGAWPVIAGVAIFLLKDKIGVLIGGGLKSAKHGETEIQFFEPNQSVKPSIEEQQSLQHLIPVDTTGIRNEMESRINEQLAQITDEKNKIEILVKNLAQQQINNAFEKVYYNIFGSQIRLLEFLSIQTEGKARIKKILPFFENTKEINPDTFESWQFSDYMNFLLAWDLVKNDLDVWSITKYGRAFIAYITAIEYTKNKIL
jgi:hypothetical protein